MTAANNCIINIHMATGDLQDWTLIKPTSLTHQLSAICDSKPTLATMMRKITCVKITKTENMKMNHKNGTFHLKRNPLSGIANGTIREATKLMREIKLQFSKPAAKSSSGNTKSAIKLSIIRFLIFASSIQSHCPP